MIPNMQFTSRYSISYLVLLYIFITFSNLVTLNYNTSEKRINMIFCCLALIY